MAELPPGFGRIVPKWFEDMSDCAMSVLWLVLALVLTVPPAFFSGRLPSPVYKISWAVMAVAWAMAILHLILCARSKRQNNKS